MTQAKHVLIEYTSDRGLLRVGRFLERQGLLERDAENNGNWGSIFFLQMMHVLITRILTTEVKVFRVSILS
ncbi:MAG: hypothetical protein B6D79_07945 [gamma proteobacterium symbiont of Ctena orbiculata]|nr:MAG: hypothetical protein B6D79_07945 [gamma proteobacterium symbiont of Ctena orbiculata]